VLRTEQDLYLNSVLKSGSVKPFAQGWDLRPGFGKTKTAVAAILYYNMKTVIVVTIRDLLVQWQSEISCYNIQNCSVVMISQLNKETCDVLIVDEAPTCMTKKGIEALLTCTPKILIGLSGTFSRKDQHGPFLTWFFGQPIKPCRGVLEILKRETSRVLTVRVVKTGIKPTVQMTLAGKLDWNVLMQSLATNEKRNETIINLIREYKDLQILVLVKFVHHGYLLRDMLGAEDCTCYFAQDKIEVIKTHRIIISTVKKIGVGISIDRLNCLIFAADVLEGTMQSSCRILRDKTQDGTIVDIVDDAHQLMVHFLARKKIYKQLDAVFV
jgi:superfamily II DNA or RNA helicase